MWSLLCVVSFLLYPVVAGITQFIYPGPAGSTPIPGIGVNDVLVLQWTTTEEFVTPVVLCHAQGAGGSVDGTDANGASFYVKTLLWAPTSTLTIPII